MFNLWAKISLNQFAYPKSVLQNNILNTLIVYRLIFISLILHRRYEIEHKKGWYEVNSKMAGWHVVEKYLEEVGKHSTLIGKYWITMFLVLRKGYYIDNHLDSNWTVLNSVTVKKRQKQVTHHLTVNLIFNLWFSLRWCWLRMWYQNAWL